MATKDQKVAAQTSSSDIYRTKQKAAPSLPVRIKVNTQSHLQFTGTPLRG